MHVLAREFCVVLWTSSCAACTALRKLPGARSICFPWRQPAVDATAPFHLRHVLEEPISAAPKDQESHVLRLTWEGLEVLGQRCWAQKDVPESHVDAAALDLGECARLLNVRK